jgi:hypothetical protein
MITNVAILTNFRTGSTNFTLDKAEEYNLPYTGELFSHERPYRIGRLAGIKDTDASSYGIMNEYILSLWNIYEELRRGAPACYKIMPSHFNSYTRTDIHYDLEHLQQVLEEADKVYYLYRKDLRAQILSWLAVRRDGSFDRTGFNTNIPLDHRLVRPEFIKKFNERITQIHRGTYQVGETYKATMDPDEPYWYAKTTTSMEAVVRQIVENYDIMSYMYKRVPGQLVCYEDYFSGEKYKPYNRQIEWLKEPQIDQYVDNWDIEGLFK